MSKTPEHARKTLGGRGFSVAHSSSRKHSPVTQGTRRGEQHRPLTQTALFLLGMLAIVAFLIWFILPWLLVRATPG